MLTVVGEIVDSQVKTYPDRRTGRTAYRVETLLATDGPSLRMTFFAKQEHVADWRAGQLPVGRPRPVHRPGAPVPEPVAADQPQDAALRRRGRRRLRGRVLDQGRRGLLPDLPPHQGRRVLGPPAGGDLRAHRRRRDPRAAARVDPRDALARSAPTRRTLDPRARRPRPGERPSSGSGSRRRWSPSWCSPGAARELRALGAQARDRRPGDLLAAFDERLPFELTGGQHEIGDEIADDLAAAAPDEPAAPGRGRLRQDGGGAAGDAPRRRPGGQAALLAPTEVLAQQHHRSITAHARRPGRRRHARRRRRGHQGRAAHRLDEQGAAPGGAAADAPAARPAS